MINKKHKKRILYSILSCVILVSLLGISKRTASAAESSLTSFNVIPILPKNQDKDILQYISITSNKGINQQISFQLSNKAKEKQTVAIKLLNAYTSPNGTIQYETKRTEDTKIINEQYKMRKFAKAPKTVTIEAGQIKTVKIDINIPKIKGTVLGGIAFQVTTHDKEQESDNKKATFSLKNKINTIYGIAVHSSKDSVAKFSYGDVYVDPMASYYAVRLPITLKSPLIVNDASIKYKVIHKGKKLFSGNKTLKFAPMTKIFYSIPFDFKEIKEGETYTLKGTLTYTDNNGEKHKQKFEKEFKYEKASSNPIINKLKAPFDNNASWIVFILLLAFILLILIILYLKKKKKEKEAIAAVELAENTLTIKDFEIAKFLVSKLNKGRKQTEILVIRLEVIRELIDKKV